MIDGNIIQKLRAIVSQMGRDNVCRNPAAFAGAILDLCDANDVKLLITALRSHYSARLMALFLDGNDDPATWAQQKAFLTEESGMSEENVETVLDAFWQAMDWHRPKPTQTKPEQGRQTEVKVDPKYKKEYVNVNRTGASGETVSRKVDPKYQKEYIDTRHMNPPPGQKPPTAGQKPPVQKDNVVHTDQVKPPQNTAPAGEKGPSAPVSPANPTVQQGRSKAIPLLISVAWLFINLMLSKGEKAGDALTRIQNGEYQLLIALAVPSIAALLVCARDAPKLLKGLSVVALGFVAGYNWMIGLYLLDRSCLNLNLIFGQAAGNEIATILTVIVGIFISLAAGGACANLRH